MRKILKTIGMVLGLLLVVLLAVKLVSDFTYFNNYDPKLPFNTKIEDVTVVTEPITIFGIEREREYERKKFSFESRSGDRVPTLMTLPRERKGKVPVIIFLHGIGQKKEFLDEISTPFNKAGFAMVCFDQIMQGERSSRSGALGSIFDFRQRPWKTINDTRRLIDYLQTDPDIDPERIYLVGASYGAITGCTVVAKEDRIKAAIMVVGGGNIKVLLDAPLIRNNMPGWAHFLAKHLVYFIMYPADPVRYAAQTSPTPLLFQNGAEDTLVTPDAGRELFNAAGEPKEMRWYPCDHPGLVRTQGPIIIQILDEALEWLLERDKPYREAAPETGAADSPLAAAA